MRFEGVWAVYFSACGSTRRVLRRMAEAAGEALALPVRELDYTLPPAREQNYAFGEGDLIFWGSPTYAGRLPNVLLPFLRGHFTGGSAAAVAVVLYGNRGYDDALKELCEVLSGNGFCPAAAAAMVGEHAFAPALAHGRPDAEDIAAGTGTTHSGSGARPGADWALLHPAGTGWGTSALFEGEAADRPPEMRPVRAVRGALPHGVDPKGGADRLQRHLHQVPGLCKGMPHRGQIFRRRGVLLPPCHAGADLRKTEGERILPAPVMNIPSLGKSRYGFCGYKYRPTLCVALTGASLPAAPRFLGRHFSRAKTPKSVCVLVKQR